MPSAAGYRLYVNELMDRQQLTLQETQRINDALNLKMEELDRVIDRAGVEHGGEHLQLGIA